MVFHFKFATERWWVFVPVILYDLAIFVIQFSNPRSIYRIKMLIIFQFFNTLFSVAMFGIRWLFKPETELNRKADATDVKTERNKLAEDEKNLKLGDSI
jgi:hypothetical protein